ncbi:hypothetical protein CHLNCDRAFT_144556 [Chlorella variabilis]|uniref:DNA mismatch repair proteins mutS family domain-containing protein n=1 Tax=Chlorella variabilis TaxID=554065 RepID=E1ZBP1_CHLVA|nr:hypothetical protein CHLNCDRAFT_144556 [Chlorella variabilis]EFN56890.1 hypothetical protein CHLNCDRAFT_144556 [Chlorella variabilis]|eukprot:XP_005848992.1 hypothetical protein CHLNCDRAFT_144556 [Chlorella variabilis]
MAESQAASHKRARGEGVQRAPSEEPDEEADSGVAMAVAVWGSRCGVAWFADGQLSCMESEDDTSGPFRHQLLQLAKLHARPAVIYVSSKADAELLRVLRSPLAGAAPPPPAPSGGTGAAGDHAVAAAGEFDVRTERSTLFLPRAARAMLEAVHVRGTPPGLTPRERLHRLNAMLSLSSEQQVCAAGALLAVLAREGRLAPASAASAADGGEEASAADGGTAGGTAAATMEVASIAEVSLDGYLLVDPASMAALQIFQQEAHPAAAMGIGQPKEGFSVFSTLNRCVTGAGRRLLRLWFRRPIVNLAVLSDRLDGIQFFLCRPDAVKPLQDMLRKVRDAPRLLARLQGLQTLPDRADFLALQASLAGTLLLRDMLVELAPEAAQASLAAAAATGTAGGASWAHGMAGLATSPAAEQGGGSPASQNPHQQQAQHQQPSSSVPGILFKAAAVIRQELVLCHNLISGVIDGSPAAAEDGFIISAGVSPELDELREQYHALPDFLTQLGQKGHLWSIVYLPQVGFVVRVEGGRLGAHLEETLPDYQFAFEGGVGGGEDGPGVYYHTDTTRRLNERFGDMQHRIQAGGADMEAGIACQLIARLAPYAPDIAAAGEAVAELDCILGLAEAARHLNLCRPQLTRANELRIEGGRHLLTEQLVDTYIPNSTHMQAGQGRIQVVTGPNFSGKSCYAKQVALITFLAHVGSFVPAASARVGLADRIFTRVASREAAAVPQSTFMIDLTQIAAMLRLGTERSLCIIDEFGKGTLAADGVGLLCATLRHFAELPCPPRVVLEVLRPQYLPRSRQLTFLTMSVLVEGQQQEQQQQQQQQQQRQQADGSGGAAAPAAAGAVTGGGSAAPPQQQQEEGGQKLAAAEQLVFLYRLEPGRAAPSFGLHCARMAGVPQGVLDRARHASGAAVGPDETGQHAQRAATYRGLLQRLAALNVHDKQAAQQLAAAAAAAAAT